MDRALAIAPEDAEDRADLYHMRGRFAYDVASLSFAERLIASKLFGSPPQATLDEALADFLEVSAFSMVGVARFLSGRTGDFG